MFADDCLEDARERKQGYLSRVGVQVLQVAKAKRAKETVAGRKREKIRG